MKLDKNQLLVCIITSLWVLGNSMSAVFVNVYLYTYTGSLIVMALYSTLRIGLFPFFFTIGGKWAQRKNFTQTTIAGVIVTMLSLIYILVVNTQFSINPNLVYIVAALVGTGEGFFWLSINSLIQIVTTEDTRALYFGLNGILNNIANIFAPIIATLLINYATSDLQGYINIFKLVLLIYALMLVVSTKVSVETKKHSFSVLKCLRIMNNKKWRYCMTSCFLYGMRDSLTLCLAGLLVYNATDGSGTLYSKLLTLFAIATILSYYISIRLLKKETLYKCYTLGGIFIASSTIVLVLLPNIYGAIYYGVVNAIALPFYSNSYQLVLGNLIQHYEEKENIIGRIVAKETYVSLGRCLGMLCVVAASYIFPGDLYLAPSVIFCSLFSVLLVVYANKHKNNTF
ncbi:MAG: MFS transporter [Erysipelotrichaceae bacterium]